MLLYPSPDTLNKAKKKVFKLESKRFSKEAPLGETQADSKELKEAVDILQRVIDNATLTINEMYAIAQYSQTQLSHLGIFRANLSKALSVIKKLNMRGLPQVDVDEISSLSSILTDQYDQYNTSLERIKTRRPAAGFSNNVKAALLNELDIITNDFGLLVNILPAKLLEFNASGISPAYEGSGFHSELGSFSGVEHGMPRRYL